MVEIPLHNGGVALVDDQDAALVHGYRWCQLTVGRDQPIKYAYAHPRDGRVYMHRLLCPGAEEVDHRNGDGLDNRRANLRPTTHRLNLANQRKQARPTSSRFKGVSYFRSGDARRKPWAAYIKVNARKRHLGYFEDELEAAAAYNAAAETAWGEFARLNGVA